ncbi:PAS domain S-box protein, partial [bacterium]|nr:PAS domain S-box protein [bacterium]
FILFLRKGSSQPANISDIEGLRIGCKINSPVAFTLADTSKFNLIPFSKDSIGLSKLILGEIDVYIGSIFICDYDIKLNKWDEVISATNNIIFKYDYSIALLDSSTQLNTILDAVIARLVDDPDFKEIQAKWFGRGISRKVVNQPLSWILLGFLVIFLFVIMFFVYSKEQAVAALKREIKKTTELSESLKELRGIKSTLYATADRAGLGIFILSDEDEIEGKFIEINEGLSDISGYGKEALMNMNISQLLVEDVRDKIIERYKLRREGEPQPEAYEIEGLRADGERIPIELFVKTTQVRDKQLTLGIVRDISRVKNLQGKLSRSDQNSRAMLSGLPQGVLVLNRERIIYVNNAFRKLVGKSPEEIRAFGIEKLVTPLHRAKIERYITALLSGKDTSKEIELELVGPRNDVILISSRPRIIDYFGKKAIIFIFENLTEEDRIRKRLGIENRVEGLGKITEHVVLEYNNTLMGILGAVVHVKSELPEDFPLLEYINIIEKDAERAAHLTQKIMSFSKDTEQRPGEILSLHKVIHDALKITPGEDLPAIEVETDFTARPDTIYGNLSQVHQAVLNLLVNAAEAMKDGGKLRIRTSNFKTDTDFLSEHPDALNNRYVRIEIEDSGPGIPCDYIDNIFEPFYTTKEFGVGAGLGLSLVYKVAKRHKGMVDVESELGKGSKFILYFPEEIQEAKEVSGSDALLTGTETILVVDDEPHVRTVLRALLSKLGYNVLLASEGQEALEIISAKSEQIDLILLDVVMPGMSGLEVFEAIKKLDFDSKVIISTGYAKDETVSDLFRNGAEALVRKPYRAATISRVIRQILDNSSSQGEGEVV